MLADFSISRLSNDMKIAVQNHLLSQILYRSLVKKKRGHSQNFDQNKILEIEIFGNMASGHIGEKS